MQDRAYRKIRDTAIALGMGEKAADRYARAVLDIPDKKKTRIDTDKRAADAALNSFERRLARLHGKTVTVGARLSFPKDWAQYRAGERKAYGGPIGDGVGVVDEVPVLAMRGVGAGVTAGGGDMRKPRAICMFQTAIPIKVANA